MIFILPPFRAVGRILSKNIMDKSKFTISKAPVECYKIRHESGMYWADITIDANEKAGRISIASDYGEWQRYWGACSGPFKEFLSGLDINYAAGKFGADKHFNLDATLHGLMDRAKDNYDRNSIKPVIDEINSLNDCSDLPEFMAMVRDCEIIMTMENHCPDICYTITPGFRRFWTDIWPILLNQFKEESKVI